ncbi:hypothetical protein BH747_13260 [Enterococcus villorum]|uniref:Uncharacterized protein n=1 Tax=Enterococcus villorum TaxID=112904 RepID=A0A1V8Y6D6_9ENTE|nr:hypothetical protein [Enterococcus villorum]OQO67906.1 hypothetical protein BH747_13260 [Enterococcus villorum]OQO72546.1 hypothetical protein BH744_11385 [Enterococcus villorum]
MKSKPFHVENWHYFEEEEVYVCPAKCLFFSGTVKGKMKELSILMVLNLRKREEYLEAEGTMIEKIRLILTIHIKISLIFLKGRLSQSRFLWRNECASVLLFEFFVEHIKSAAFKKYHA